MTGSAGADVFYAGNDTVVTGGKGADSFVFSAPGGGTVTIGSSAVLVSEVAGHVYNGGTNGVRHTLVLTAANFAGVEGSVINVDDGDSGNTVIAASLPGVDSVVVHAGGSIDTVIAGAGNDQFFAGGNTTMTGGPGANECLFPAPGANAIVDFAASSKNEIVFSNGGFGLGETGASATPQALPAVQLAKNAAGAFTNTKQRFAYNTTGGDLSFSATGSAGTAQLVAHLTGAPALPAGNLFFNS